MKRSELIDILRTTRWKLGAGYPVLVDMEGNIIDGIHRLRADPNWPRRRIEVSGVESKILRLVLNVARRSVSTDEKRKLLGVIARETGWIPKEIAENIGMSYTWVMKYLPDEYKVRPGAGPRVTRRVTQPEVKPKRPFAEVVREAAEVGARYVSERDVTLDRMIGLYGSELLDLTDRVFRGSYEMGFDAWRKAVKRVVEHLLLFLDERGLMEEFIS